MRVERPPDEAGHRERGGQVTEGLNRLQFTQGHGGEAGVDLEGEGVGSARLTMSESRELLAVAEEKFNLEAGLVIPVERDGVQVQIGAKQEGDPLGPPVKDDHDADAPAQAGELDEGGFEEEIRVGGSHGGKHRRVPAGPIDLPGIAAGGPPPGVGSGIEVTRIGIAPEFADQVEL
jgi:hypothetical protein